MLVAVDLRYYVKAYGKRARVRYGERARVRYDKRV
jgi:hypothetical protein